MTRSTLTGLQNSASVALVMLTLCVPKSAGAQTTLETVVITGSRSTCPSGWTCFSFVDASGENALYAANYSRVAKTEAIAEIKAALRQTLRDIVQQTIRSHKFSCNAGLPFESYLAGEARVCVENASRELARKTPPPLWPAFGMGGTAILDTCMSGLRLRLNDTPATPCTAGNTN